MPRSMVGLLAAVAAAMAILTSLAHGYLFWAAVGDVAGAAGLVGYATAPGLAFLAGLSPAGKKNGFE
jgi:hypothetical protein